MSSAQKKDTFSSKYKKTITAQAVGNLVQYMTFTLDDIEEVLNEERYHGNFLMLKNYYNTINEAQIRSSMGVPSHNNFGQQKSSIKLRIVHMST